MASGAMACGMMSPTIACAHQPGISTIGGISNRRISASASENQLIKRNRSNSIEMA